MDYLCKNKAIEYTIEERVRKMSDEIVDRLVAYRKELCKTRRDIADATGIPLVELEQIESKETTPSIGRLIEYADSLGLVLQFEAVMPEQSANKRPLPIGVTDFREVSSKFCYVDKTLLIKEILDRKTVATLFVRPRRFGKTLNMDMLRVFFEKASEDTSVYFKDKKIWKCGKKYQEHQGKYPVILLTFKDVKFTTWEENVSCLKLILATEFNRHPELFDSDKCDDFEKRYFSKVAYGEADEVTLTQALLFLSRMLFKHHGKKAIILIDEYDTPIQQGHMQGYYDRSVNFMRAFLSAGLKDNSYLAYGFLTGILRVAKESIFSSLNNLEVNSMLDNQYSEYFGFTPMEVRQIAEYYGVPEKYEEICEWYDGYRFGKTDIFNPWSVIGYFNHHYEPRAYWVSTAKNDVIGEILEKVSDETRETLHKLLQGESVFTQVDTSVIYPEIQNNPASVYSFLLVSGYLKVVKSELIGGEYMCELAIPNKELYAVYRKEILSKLTDLIAPSTVMKIHEAIYTNNADKLQKELHKLLLQTVSYNDASSESFYHGFVLGLCAMMDNQYYVTSNRESGEGRFDIQLMPHKEGLPGILMELKWEKNSTEDALKKMAKQALAQIAFQKYDVEMKMRGVPEIYKFGVAFCGKKVEVVTEIDE